MKDFLKPLTLSLLCGGLLLPAAAQADRGDIRRLAETRISLTDAIAIAEKSQGGKAYDASLDDDSFTPEYEVNVVVGDKIFEVSVDGVTGEIRKVREDRDD
jgi:uncharacterized membrane protein YkoI